MKIPVAVQHPEPAELHVQVRKLRELAYVIAPDAKHLFAIAVMRRQTEQPADVIEYHDGFRKRTHEIDGIGQLRVELP